MRPLVRAEVDVCARDLERGRIYGCLATRNRAEVVILEQTERHGWNVKFSIHNRKH